MERKLTIRETLCVRWLFCLITMLLVSVGMQAEDYDLWVAGVQVTDANASNITGENITAGTVSFNNSTNTLTLNNATVNGIVTSTIDNLKINLVGVSVFNVETNTSTDTYLFNYTGSNSNATLTYTAENLGATVQGIGTTNNYNLEPDNYSSANVHFDYDGAWKTYFSNRDDLCFCEVTKPYLWVVDCEINDANKNDVGIEGVTFDLANNKVTFTDYHHNNYSDNPDYLIKSNLSNLRVEVTGSSSYAYLNTQKKNSEIVSRGFYYTGASGETSSLNVVIADGASLRLCWSGETATTDWLVEGFTQTNIATDASNVENGTPFAQAGTPYSYQISIFNVESYDLRVAGVNVNSVNANRIVTDNDNGYVSFDAETNTLTLDNYFEQNDLGGDTFILNGIGNLTINLAGNTTLRGYAKFLKKSGVETGNYSATFKPNTSNPGSLTFYPADIDAWCEGHTIECISGLTLSNGNDDYDYIDISSADALLIVGSIPVDGSNAGDILGDGKLSFNADNNTLTLNGATLNGAIYWKSNDPLTIALKGENSITCTNGSYAIQSIAATTAPGLSFVKASDATDVKLTLSVLKEMEDAISGFNPITHADMFMMASSSETMCTTVVSNKTFGGDGTANSPFLIKTADDLKLFASYYNTGYFNRNSHVQLYNDINCENQTGFTTIANNSDGTFCGVFDGNQKTISNLTMTGMGLFGYVEKDEDYVGTIKDLTLSNYNITGNDYATGGIVATLSGGAVVSNCIVTNSTIACANNQYNPEVGGIVARLYGSTVTGCTVNNVKVKAETSYTGGSGAASYVGGIVGNASEGTIESCVVMNGSKITNYYADEFATLNAGAIVGNQYETTLSENYYYYDVNVEKLNGTDVTNKIVKSNYEQRGVGGQTYNEQTEQYEDNPDIFEDNGAVMYTQTVTLPAETPQATATVTGEENTYYSTTVISDALAYTVAPGQTVTLNANPANGYAIGSLTATNTTKSAAITTTPTALGDGIMQYTFTMPDAPVTVTVTTVAAYGISVAGVAVTELNYTDVLGDGKVSFALPVQSLETPAESKPATLTLNGATINGSIVSSLTGELAVHLLGSNVIDGGWSEDANGQYAFVSESESASLAFTTDDENPGQLLMKNTYRNNGYGQYYLNGFRWNKTFGNGLVEGYSNDQYGLKCMIAVAPVVTPGEGLYWTDQQYTIPEGTQITCSDSQGHAVEVNVNSNSFTLTERGKYTISISKAVTVDESNFSLSNSGYYIVHNKPGFSKEAGSYTGSQTITLTNLPEDLLEGAEDYPQVWYYLGEDDDKAVRVYSAEQEIAVSESTKVCVYFLDEDSGKVLKSANVEAEYTIRQDPALRFYTSENSYMSTGSTENISYGEEFTSPVLKGKIGNEYTNELTDLGITYSSSDETVATIDQTGKITIVGGGYVTITATSQQTDVYAASSTNFILEIRPADPNVSLSEGAYYTGQSLTMLRVGENGTMYYSYGDKSASQRTVYPEGGISLPKGCYDFYPYTRCGTDEQNIWSYGNAHRMMYVYDQPTISKDAGTYDDKIEVEITNLPESGYYSASVYYYFDDDEEHAVQYTSGSKITINESKTLNVYIYVEGDSGKTHKTEIIERQYVIRQNAGLAYTQNNEPVEVAEYTIGGSNNAALPTLQNENKLTVTYTSSKETVATVNEEGVVTPVGVGETTITAASAQTATLQAGEASYTLKVYKDLNHQSITVSVANATYTGSEVEPDVTVKDGTTDVTAYFTFSYSDNVQVGTNAKVTIVPNNDLEVNFYVGSRTETFAIDNRTLEIGKDVNFASGQKWASFYTTTENLELPDGVMAYIVTGVANSAVSVKAINYVPKNVPVLIENESTTTTDNASAEGNLLQGTTESTAVSGIEGNVYVLYNGGFTRATSGAIPAGRAYLVLEQNAGARLSIFEDDATGIGSVANSQQLKGNEQYYDLQGRKVESHAKKGLYIKNGRKVVVK